MVQILPITVTIIIKNGARCLKEVLGSLSSFDEVLVADNGSTDETPQIAQSFKNVSYHKIPFEGFGPARNLAEELSKHDWILSIDCDEVVSGELVDEIKSIKLDPLSIYSIPFHNFFNGRWIKWCGWHPERHIRLYNRKSTAFSSSLVHEGVVTKGMDIKKLKSPIYHYPYGGISDFLIKMERYSSLFASQNRGKRRSSPLIALWHGWGAFFKSYVIKRGFLGGYEGLLISYYNAHTAFYKYLKLYHLNKSTPC